MSPLRFERGAAMVARVFDEARALVHEDAARIAAAVHLALEQREEHIVDDHDPRYLHPARTVRILLADVSLRDVTALAAAPLFDSVDARLAARLDRLEPVLATAVTHIPRPDHDDVLERLVTAEENLAIVALAERLDHARHLHMRDDLPWPAFHASIRAHWIPAARRIAPALARRFEHWADAFERRLVLPR
jgi:hypothetical protein